MTQHDTPHGWRDERLDAREGLGQNAHHFAALAAHRIKLQRQQTRVRWIEAILLALAFIGALVVAHTAERVWTGWNAAAIEAQP